ncbi:MAG: DUF6600 domain-containing protein [Acidobacteriota bacterium]
MARYLLYQQALLKAFSREVDMVSATPKITIKKMMLAILIPASIVFVSGTLLAEDEEVANYGRVRYLENGITLTRADEKISEEGTVNSPIFPDDLVVTGRDQRAELQLADSSFVRLDGMTRLEFQSLADMHNQYEQSNILKLYDGSIYVEAKNMDDKNKNFQIDTPFASIYILTNGTFRINVDSERKVEVFSYRGVAEVVGENDSVLLRSGKMTFITFKSDPADPRAFNSFYGDSFDRWNDERDDFYASTSRVEEYYENTPYEVRRYYSELSYYGNWVYLPAYGYCWYPYNVYAGWRPYYDGYWYWGPRGYIWVSYEPWGWAPYHYGRWTWVSGYGWIWIPGRVWSGAWVYWSYGSTYLGWCPLDFWDRPAFISFNLYLDFYDFRTWNFIMYKDVVVRNVRHAVVRGGIVERDLKASVVTSNAPRVRPTELSRDPEARKAVFRDANEHKNIREVMKNRERVPASLANFKDKENKRIEQIRSKAVLHPMKPTTIGNMKERTPRTDAGKPTMRKVPDIPDRGKPETEDRGKSDTRGQESNQTRTFPRSQTQDWIKGRTDRKDQETDQQKDMIQNSIKDKDTGDAAMNRNRYKYKDASQDRYRTADKNRYTDGNMTQDQEVKSYPRRRPEEYSQQSREQQSFQRKQIEESNRLRKMLKDMSQEPRPKEIETREPPQRKMQVREAPPKKKEGKPASTGDSKGSSGRSESSGRKSRGR